ncbi:DMT family transporter [Tistrella mobilis]|uniref:DMT family transporter n=1 Tax=Tistrella mobilis TaxID=171437 RepID=UPI00355780EA
MEGKRAMRAGASGTPGSDTRGPYQSGVLQVLTVAAIWGVNFPIAKSVLDQMSPLAFSATRYITGAVLLLILLRLRGVRLHLQRRDMLPLIGLGLVGITAFQGFWATGLHMTSASSAAIVMSAAPIFGAIFGHLTGQKAGPRAWAGILVAFAGVALVVNNSLTGLHLETGDLAGDLVMLGAAAAWALYSALSRHLLARLGALAVTAWTMLFGALALCLLALPGLADQPWAALGAADWAAWGFSVVFASALAFVWWYEGIARLGVARAMVFTYLTPVIAVAVAVLLLGEELTLARLLGAAVVITGVRLARRG